MRRLAALVVAGVVIVVLVAAQLLLPGIAADRVRAELARHGQVLDVSVSAFPAIELLWHHADSVVVHLGRYRPVAGRLSAELDRVTGVGSLEATAREVDYGLLALHDVSLVKRGDRLTGTATVTEADLRSALPILSSVEPVASGDGSLTLRGTALGISVDATVQAENGRLVVVPDVPLIGGLATVTAFSSGHIAVGGVSAAPAPGGFTIQATATVH